MDRKRKIDLSSASEEQNIPSFNENSKVNEWTGLPYSSRYYDILKKRQTLPVYEFRDELLRKVRDNQTVVVEGETGSGKVSISY
jgi:pre-mRNA-splicing factor ATP-dependent RNA helicase DHX15/PRP43